MVALTGWSTPSSDASFSNNGPASIQYTNGYFIAAQAVDGATNAELKYATDAKGTWTLATLPARPSGVDKCWDSSPNRVFYDGTHYAMCVRYRNTAGTTTKARILYATSLSGTWTAYEFDTSNNYHPYDFGYHNGQWVIVGSDVSVDPGRAFIATSSTANGTYTFYTATSETGLDPADLSAGKDWVLRAIRYANGTYVTEYGVWNGTTLGGSDGSGLLVSTSLTSGWAEPTSYSAYPDFYYINWYQSARGRVNGYWFAYAYQVAAGYNEFLYASTPSGTWTVIDSGNIGLTTKTENISGISHDGTNYIVVGGASGTRFARYAAATGAPPSSSWTNVTTGLAASHEIWDIVYVDPIHVVVQNNGAIRYSNDIPYVPPPSTATFTLLRQRQSPVRAPSRVRGPDLRQRQTPFVT